MGAKLSILTAVVGTAFALKATVSVEGDDVLVVGVTELGITRADPSSVAYLMDLAFEGTLA